MGLIPSKFKDYAKDEDLSGSDVDRAWAACKKYGENEGEKDCPKQSCPTPSCPACPACPTTNISCPPPRICPPSPTCPPAPACPEQEEPNMIIHYSAYGVGVISIMCLILIIIIAIAYIIYTNV